MSIDELAEANAEVGALRDRKRPHYERRRPDAELIRATSRAENRKDRVDRLDSESARLEASQHRRRSHLAAHEADALQLKAIEAVIDGRTQEAIASASPTRRRASQNHSAAAPVEGTETANGYEPSQRLTGPVRRSTRAVGVSANESRWGLPSDSNYLQEVVEADKICGVARVQTGVVSVRRGGDQQVERTRPGLTSDMGHRRGDASVAGCNVVVDWECIETALQHCQPSQPFRSR